MKQLRIVIALALMVLAVYVLSSHNVTWYIPYIAAAAVLGSWLATKTRNGIWLVPILFALAIARAFKWVEWDTTLIGFGTLPGVLGVQVFAEVLRPYIPRQVSTPVPVAGAQMGFPPARSIVPDETQWQAPATPPAGFGVPAPATPAVAVDVQVAPPGGGQILTPPFSQPQPPQHAPA